MYDVAQLSSISGLSVDTIRYYQTQGLLPAPEKEGRRAVYGEEHRRRLERIRDLTDRGFSLKSLRELFTEDSHDTRVLRAALEEGRSEAVYKPREFARALGIPYPVFILNDKTLEALNARFDLPGPIPCTIALDASGKIVDRDEGDADLERFRAMMRRALGM